MTPWVSARSNTNSSSVISPFAPTRASIQSVTPMPTAIALRSWGQRSRLTPWFHRVIHEFRRSPKNAGPPHGDRVPIVDTGGNSLPQFHRVWLARLELPYPPQQRRTASQAIRESSTSNTAKRSKKVSSSLAPTSPSSACAAPRSRSQQLVRTAPLQGPAIPIGSVGPKEASGCDRGHRRGPPSHAPARLSPISFPAPVADVTPEHRVTVFRHPHDVIFAIPNRVAAAFVRFHSAILHDKLTYPIPPKGVGVTDPLSETLNRTSLTCSTEKLNSFSLVSLRICN